MGKWVHRLSNLDKKNKTAICEKCGLVAISISSGKFKCKISRRYQSGHNRWNKEYKKWKPNYKYRKFFRKSKICEGCGIENEDFRFYDVNHKDGDHDNNKINNLELLCPNCHRMETLLAWNEKRMKKYNRNFIPLTKRQNSFTV